MAFNRLLKRSLCQGDWCDAALFAVLFRGTVCTGGTLGTAK